MKKGFKFVVLLSTVIMSIFLVACARKKPKIKDEEKKKVSVSINLSSIHIDSVKMPEGEYVIDGCVAKIELESFPYILEKITAKEENLYFKNHLPAKFSEDTERFVGCYPQREEAIAKPSESYEEIVEEIIKYGIKETWKNIYYKGNKYEQIDNRYFRYEKVIKSKNPMTEVGEWSDKILDYSLYDIHMLGQEIEYRGSYIQSYINHVMKKKMQVTNIKLPLVNGQETVVTSLPKYDENKCNISNLGLSDYAKYKVIRIIERTSPYNYLRIWTGSKQKDRQNYLLSLGEDGKLELTRCDKIFGIKIVF